MGWDWDEFEMIEVGLDVDWMEIDEIFGKEEGMLIGILGIMEEMVIVDFIDWEGEGIGGRILLAGNILLDWLVWIEEFLFSSWEMLIFWEVGLKFVFDVELFDDWFKMFKRVW